MFRVSVPAIDTQLTMTTAIKQLVSGGRTTLNPVLRTQPYYTTLELLRQYTTSGTHLNLALVP